MLCLLDFTKQSHQPVLEMARCEPDGDEYSFNDAIENQKLPILLQSTNNCTLDGNTVLEKDQYITILDRCNVDLLQGRDCNGKNFRLSKEMVEHFQVDIVEEFYPKTIDELRKYLPEVTFVQTKKRHTDDSNNLCALDTFQFCNFLDETHHNVVLQTRDQRICLESRFLLVSDLFVLVKIKEVKRFNSFIENIDRSVKTLIRFKDPTTDTSELGNVFIESIGNYEVAHTVSAIKGGTQLKYETFPIDRRIMFRRVGKKVPRYVETFGAYNSPNYQEKLTEIKMLMKYDVYSPRFYAHLIIDNHLMSPPRLQRPRQLDLGNERTGGVRESIRKGINKLRLKASPSNENLSKLAGGKHLNKLSESGFYKPLATKVDNRNVGVGIDKDRKTTLPRTSSDLPTQKSTLKTDENPLYDIDTMTLKKLKEQLRSERSATMQSPRTVKRGQLPRPKSLDMDHSLFYEDMRKERQDIYEAPYSQLSPTGVKHISDYQILPNSKCSPSLPIPPRSSFFHSHSVSPPRGSSSFDKGLDSGVDSPEDGGKSLAEILKIMQDSSPPKIAEQPSRQRSQSALENRNIERVDLNISWPYNFQHLTPTSEPHPIDSIYAIPNKKLSTVGKNFSDLDETMSFPELSRMEILRSRSEPFLNQPDGAPSLPIYEEVIYQEVKLDLAANTRHERELKSLREIKGYSIPQVVELLRTINLERHIQTFKIELIRGSLLIDYDEETHFYNEMGFTRFEARKLYKYVHGWRPLKSRSKSFSRSVVSQMDRHEWTIEEVVDQMELIRLPQVARFCSEHLIDGALLLDLTQKHLLSDLEEDGLKLKNIERDRLRSYMMKELSYDEDDMPFLENLM